jgi:hypothetical protein
MDWKEGAKWFIVIVGAGVAGELVMLLINRTVTVKAEAVARETARTEVERVIQSAVAQLQAQQTIKPPTYIAPQKDQGYVYQM